MHHRLSLQRQTYSCSHHYLGSFLRNDSIVEYPHRLIHDSHLRRDLDFVVRLLINAHPVTIRVPFDGLTRSFTVEIS